MTEFELGQMEIAREASAQVLSHANLLFVPSPSKCHFSAPQFEEGGSLLTVTIIRQLGAKIKPCQSPANHPETCW